MYVGVTNDLSRRYFEHTSHANPQSFTTQYNLDKLVYYEECASVDVVIHREKQLKAWHRQWKIELIEKDNPDWNSLNDEFWGDT